MTVPSTTPARRDEVSAPWFDGLAKGVLLIHRCPRCGLHSRPATATCPACHDDRLDWVHAADTGTVVCAIVDHGEPEPIALGLVELDEGPWLAVRLTEIRMHPGTRVALTVLASPGGEPFPAFAPEA